MAFLREVFSEQTPTGPFGSFGRVAFGFIIAVVMGCVIYQTHKGTPSLEAWAWFLLSAGGVTYGANKVTAVWGEKRLDKQ